MKKWMKAALAAAVCLGLCVCSSASGSSESTENETVESTEKITLRVAAAASLETSFEDSLIPLFESENENITIEGVYDSSGKLVTQIENGLDADVFMSAATKQMDQLVEEGYVEESEVVDPVENQLVLVKTAGSDVDVTSIEDILNADTISIGDPDYVPAGSYARQALENLGIWDQVLEKASLASNVTEALSWVEAGSAQVGLVYATDAASPPGVEVIAPVDSSLLDEQVIYPIAPLKDSSHKEAADAFVKFMQSDEAMAILEEAGFIKA